MIRVHALVPYALGRVGGQRYRIEQWASHMRGDGVDVSFAPFLSAGAMDVLYRTGHTLSKVAATCRGYLRRVTELWSRDVPDVVYVYREAALLGPAWLERLHALRRPLVFDFDDAIYLPDASEANSWTRFLKPRKKAERICRMARRVMVGNEELAQFARAHASSVSVIPSTIDTDVYDVRPRPANPVPVVGWTGSVTTVRHLLPLAPALRRLRQRIPFVMRVIGGDLTVDGVEMTSIPWSAESEVDDLRPLDIGVMPLPDDLWSRGKCGMKALQYMALGIPPVVSPVGANATIVRHGVNGLHARTEDEWVDAMHLLLSDAALRARLGVEARATVEEEFSARTQAPRVAKIFQEAAVDRSAS